MEALLFLLVAALVIGIVGLGLLWGIALVGAPIAALGLWLHKRIFGGE